MTNRSTKMLTQPLLIAFRYPRWACDVIVSHLLWYMCRGHAPSPAYNMWACPRTHAPNVNAVSAKAYIGKKTCVSVIFLHSILCLSRVCWRGHTPSSTYVVASYPGRLGGEKLPKRPGYEATYVGVLHPRMWEWQHTYSSHNNPLHCTVVKGCSIKGNVAVYKS